jgi:hypothetical protein
MTGISGGYPDLVVSSAVEICPAGSYVVSITGKTGPENAQWVRGLRPLLCSDGTLLNLPQPIRSDRTSTKNSTIKMIAAAPAANSTTTITSSAGFVSANINAGDYLLKFQPVPVGGAAGDFIGANYEFFDRPPVECPPGKRVVGMSVGLGGEGPSPKPEEVIYVALVCDCCTAACLPSECAARELLLGKAQVCGTFLASRDMNML